MIETDKALKTRDFLIHYIDTRIDSAKPLEHFHDSYEIDYFIKADIQLFCKDKLYHISDGDMLFIKEFEMHKITYTPEKDYSRFVVNFKRSFLEDVLGALELNSLLKNLEGLGNYQANLTLKKRAEMQAGFRDLLQESNSLQNSPYSKAKVKLQLCRLLINFSEYLERPLKDQEPSSKDLIAKKIINYIDANYARPLTLDMLEQELFTSKYYISHIFKEVTGFTIIEYLQNRRVIEVQKRLISTEKPPEIIGSECGFKNLQHFYRTFKEIAKVTPKKYRDLNKRSFTSTLK